MVTFEALLVHGPLVIVHLNVDEAPGVKPVTVVVGLDGLVMVPVPEISVQLPVPTVGVFPVSVAVVPLHGIVWLGPALATVGLRKTVIFCVVEQYP